MADDAKPARRRVLSLLIGIPLLLVTLWVCLMAFMAHRILPLLWIVVFMIAMIAWPSKRSGLKWVSAIGCAALLFSPLDVSLINLPGPPRIVPLQMGLPSRAMIERADRNEVVLGGCIVSGYEPRWLVVW